MTPAFRSRLSRGLILGSVVLFMIAGILPTKDRFVMDVGGEKRVITRQDNPLVYWGTESGILVVAIAFFGFGFYRARKE